MVDDDIRFFGPTYSPQAKKRRAGSRANRQAPIRGARSDVAVADNPVDDPEPADTGYEGDADEDNAVQSHASPPRASALPAAPAPVAAPLLAGLPNPGMCTCCYGSEVCCGSECASTIELNDHSFPSRSK